MDSLMKFTRKCTSLYSGEAEKLTQGASETGVDEI